MNQFRYGPEFFLGCAIMLIVLSLLGGTDDGGACGPVVTWLSC